MKKKLIAGALRQVERKLRKGLRQHRIGKTLVRLNHEYQRIVSNDKAGQTALLRQYLWPVSGLRVLDIGCGSGIISNAYPKDCFYVGLDINHQELSLASCISSHQFVAGDGVSLPFREASFDRITSICTFHHLSDTLTLEVLAEVRRLLAPGGVFLLIDKTKPTSLCRFGAVVLAATDRGRFIRPKEAYPPMIETQFDIERQDELLSFIGELAIFQCR